MLCDDALATSTNSDIILSTNDGRDASLLFNTRATTNFIYESILDSPPPNINIISVQELENAKIIHAVFGKSYSVVRQPDVPIGLLPVYRHLLPVCSRYPLGCNPVPYKKGAGSA
ncbi:uncharacterized protein ASCRUDRAFT_115204 [Ascoidea rubescens DSM 1968]|uniref:Uncharacterized protein n=1 Tax=Ascoidea rubescens DSM 1968 TaxID=1344418 RepID=A0A1D2VBJ6_9ASCO|nr:hypothetical protein ASCRUDRAFT_115204 [Ascoidea rubescens DSM 1968]ODV58981.1 hypothetical protein ASCRUDRAFT_115204 [Ascoidea rubescens DSM 1968]